MTREKINSILGIKNENVIINKLIVKDPTIVDLLYEEHDNYIMLIILFTLNGDYETVYAISKKVDMWSFEHDGLRNKCKKLSYALDAISCNTFYKIITLNEEDSFEFKYKKKDADFNRWKIDIDVVSASIDPNPNGILGLLFTEIYSSDTFELFLQLMRMVREV